MMTDNLVDGLNICGELSIGGLCEDCIFGKHTAHPYNDNKSREKEVLKRVYIDIWGPSQVQSAGGALYFMIILDGFSSYRTVTFLKSKSVEITLKVFKGFQAEAERQTGKRLKRVWLDMGREWYNNAWESYRDEQGLEFEFTIPYAHQQNGVAERSMRIILDRTRTALAESGLPVNYWADAVQTMVYTQNLLPNPRQPKTILAELWTGRCQDVFHLWPFGCTSYAHVPLDLNQSKLNLRSVKTALLGYFGRDGYKLLEKNTGTIFKSRDVIFEEGITHLAKQPTPTTFFYDDNLFIDKPWQNDDEIRGKEDLKPEPTPLLMHGIAPRPLPSSELHKDNDNEQTISSANDIISTITKNSVNDSDDLPLALRKPRRTVKPTTWL